MLQYRIFSVGHFFKSVLLFQSKFQHYSLIDQMKRCFLTKVLQSEVKNSKPIFNLDAGLEKKTQTVHGLVIHTILIYYSVHMKYVLSLSNCYQSIMKEKTYFIGHTKVIPSSKMIVSHCLLKIQAWFHHQNTLKFQLIFHQTISCLSKKSQSKNGKITTQSI